MGKFLAVRDNNSFSKPANTIVNQTKAFRLYKPLAEFAWKPASKEEREKERVPSLQLMVS